MDRLIAINLLIKLGAAAAVASVLVRSRRFKELIFTEQRTLTEKLYLVLFIGVPFALGVVVRVSTPSFLAADLAFEAAVIMGIMGGYVAGVAGGILVALPAAVHGEWLSLPMYVLAGVVAGALRNGASDREEIWSFSPFIDLSIYRWIRRNLPWPKFDWQISFFFTIIALRLVKLELLRHFPGRIFGVDSYNPWLLIAILASSVMGIAIPLKIWNNTRMERKLEEQQRLLLHARMEALQNQINPHFLFNTLNSVSSLVRFDPDTARDIIVKLSHILRRLLRQSDAFVNLREEVQFIDDYLDIEVVRFGRDKLKVVKELEQDSLDVMVPSMLLQPLVENSIKHGLSPKIEGGTIFIRSRLTGNQLLLEVEDDGVGMGAANLLEPRTGIGGTGIGMANVAERLRVLYGDTARMVVNASATGGTVIQLQLPLIQTYESGGVETMQETRR
ncbi:MAG TPA: histidine kinase [Terriglobales bacterium]|nr:histidine kinase [Terriglobales bacterium]